MNPDVIAAFWISSRSWADANRKAVASFKAAHEEAIDYILKNPEAGKLIIPAPMKNHTDEELMLVETLVGRTPPFSAADGYSAPRRGY